MPRPRTFRYQSTTSEFAPIKAKAFIQDPLVARTDGLGLIELKLPGEAWLGPGPTTARVEVIDEDEEGNVWADPVEPLARGGGFSVGRGDPVKNFRHHQVNVWAHVVRTLGILEDARMFGRRIAWAFPGGRLVIRPHAFEEQNAYYDRDLGAIHFGYFRAGGGADGDEEVLYSCLSHDIITHELGHAVLDGLKPLYYELESPDVAGFHEYFGDALSMVSSLTMKEVVRHVVRERKEKLDLRSLVSDIALEFGSSGHGDQPLRSAANRRKMSDLNGTWQEHDYSEVLSGAFYDLLLVLYRDMVKRRAKELDKGLDDGQVVVGALIGAAETTSRMMLRALDYCPPCGLTYLDYARAILRSDEVAYPLDARGYREMLVKVLRKRGIGKSNRDLTVEKPLRNTDLRDYDIDRLVASPTDAYAFLDSNREILEIPRDVNFRLERLYRTKKLSSGRYYPPQEIVLEFSWPHEVRVPKKLGERLGMERATLWCGGSIVFDTNGNVLHFVVKTATKDRKRRLLDYLKQLDSGGYFAARYSVRHEGRRAVVTKRARLRHATGA
ncbi:hypothetical protein Poly30_53850 [Planctomycetes bacterium Poly30]|uniref:Uncharacterized protein n=1 Tax=Saltatorellus ferox TaxID=2528018 RepID=A0A518F0H2_9BACT|nr:hypothetical protein Poly30_53850 [Planctomycetes bacterium Poly30]